MNEYFEIDNPGFGRLYLQPTKKFNERIKKLRTNPHGATWSPAIALSILKWWTLLTQTLLRREKISDGGFMTCGCCRAMLGGCNTCPIFVLTGSEQCKETPYDQYLEATTWQEAAQVALAEYIFLIDVWLWWTELRMP